MRLDQLVPPHRLGEPPKPGAGVLLGLAHGASMTGGPCADKQPWLGASVGGQDPAAGLLLAERGGGAGEGLALSLG